MRKSPTKRVLTESRIEHFKKLASDGYTRNEIIAIMDITRSQCRYIAGALKIKTRDPKKIKIVDEINGLAECSECNKVKTLDNFRIRQKQGNNPYHITYCYDCQYKKYGEYVNSDVNAYLSNRWLMLKSRAGKKAIPFTISREDFIQQYFLQDGLCFYSGRKLVCTVLNGLEEKNQLSADKIIPGLGYVAGNVVFCTKQINLCKNDLTLDEIKLWMPSWYEQIINFIDTSKKA